MKTRAKDCRCGQRDLSQLSAWLGRLAEPNRLKIICCLGRRERCVCEIMDFLGLPANLLSHHLKNLKKGGLLKCRRQGKYQYYSVNRPALDSLIKDFSSILKGGK